MTFALRGCFAVAVVLALAACSPSNISGVYVAKSYGVVEMLELVQINDGTISGKFTGISVSKSGTIQDVNGSVTGVVHGDVISVTIQFSLGPISTSLVATTMAGTVGNNALRLNTDASRGEVRTVEFLRSDMSEFNGWAESIRSVSQVKLAALAAAEAKKKQEREIAVVQAREAAASAAVERGKQNFIGTVARFGDRADRFQAAVERISPQFANATARYSSVTDRAEHLQRSADAAPTAFAKEQIVFQLNTLLGFGGPMETAHDAAVVSAGEFETAVHEIESSARSLAERCNRSEPKDDVIVAACGNLAEATAIYAKANTKMRSAIAAADAAYVAERGKQQSILKQAEGHASR